MPTDFQSWFCLQGNRRNFQIDPLRDRTFLFGQPEWEEEINMRLKRAQLLGTPVRLLWWGQFGIGKTHRLRHTEYLVQKHHYDYRPCYCIASDLEDKTGFERLHYELVNSLGRDEMQRLTSSYLLRARTAPDSVPSLSELCGTARDVEEALRMFGSDNANTSLPAWRFLCGLTLRPNELQLANVTKEALNSSHEYSAVLSALARIIKIEMGKELLYLIDEFENVEKVSNKTAFGRWQESLRSVLDISDISLVIAVGSERFQDVPRLIIQSDIVRRIQKDNYVHMNAFETADAREFVKGLLAQWIDPEKRAALEASEKFSSVFPDYDSQYYPFTAGAFEKYCDFAVVDPRTAKPSEIIAKLDNIAAEAFFRKRRLITKDHLTEMGIA